MDINNLDADLYIERLDRLHRHVSNVQEAGKLLASRLFKRNTDADRHIAHELVCNVHIHDASKFRGIEWQYLHAEVKEESPELFKAAWLNHVQNNPHHCEYWGGIEYMPPVYLAEFVCDTYARATEFGTDYTVWLKEEASKKYQFSLNGKTWKLIKDFKELLLDPTFK